MNDYDAASPEPGSDDLLLAYMRGELTDSQHAQLVERLNSDPALEDELATLEAIAQFAQDERSAKSADASLARFTTALRTMSAPSLMQVPVSARPGHASWLGRLREWMDTHSSVLQPALIALVVVQAGVIAHYADTSGGVSDTTSTLRGPSMSCNDVWVTFKDGVTEQALRNWLTLYGATIASGPDNAGRYRIAFPDADTRTALLQSADLSRLTSHVDPPAGCPAN